MSDTYYEDVQVEHGQGKVKEIKITHEMKNSFLSYAMSVIVARALPDARDGLKPVHRRILYGMDQLGVYPDKSFKKSARIVGDVMGKYHPHGDSAIYDSMVRMAQDFSYRYPLVNGHGNFGSVDGDGAAAMRYTEAKMAKITVEMLKDIDKNTVDFIDNYDASEKEPSVLPSRIPNLLVNGASGIAVGMATAIPPHNLTEVIDGYVALIDEPEISVSGLMKYVKGPDFPTGGTILGAQGIKDAFETGRGNVKIRAKSEVVTLANGKHQIIVKEIPYQVNKTVLIERIAELAKDKKVEGINDLRDESNRNGMRLIIELKKDVNPEVVLNNLYKNSQLQTSFSVNMLALVDGTPKVLNLKECLEVYYKHQLEVLIRRTKFDLEKAKARRHILEGFIICLDNIDEVIRIIKESYDDTEARLIERFGLSDIQVKAILAMPLRRLSGLETEKIHQELNELLVAIANYEEILASKDKQKEILKKEILEVKEKYGDGRRTEIDVYGDLDIDDEDLIPEEDVIIALTSSGYVKRMNIDVYRSQNRGGRGKTGMKVNEDDVIDTIVSTSTHDFLLFFTSFGRVYKIKGYKIPNYGRNSKGLPIVNLLNLNEGESVAAVVNIHDFEEGYLFFTTSKGIVKRTKVSDFQNIRNNGIRAVSLRDDDTLMSVLLTDGNKDIIIGASNGKAIRFNEQDARDMGRTASGVRGILLEDEDKVIGVTCVSEDKKEILVITENGYGKRTDIDEYRCQSRGGKGVKTLNVTTKNGSLAKLLSVVGDEDLLVVTNKGMIIRVPIEQIAQTKRSTQGVIIMHLTEDQKVTTIAVVPKMEESEFDEDASDDEILRTKEVGTLNKENFDSMNDNEEEDIIDQDDEDNDDSDEEASEVDLFE